VIWFFKTGCGWQLSAVIAGPEQFNPCERSEPGPFAFRQNEGVPVLVGTEQQKGNQPSHKK